MTPTLIDISGQRFGQLVAIRHVVWHKGRRRYGWECLCDCGRTIYADSTALRFGHTMSCGQHGHKQSKTQEYAIYRGIIARCENSHVKHFPSYGGRGIRVCERWRESFLNFLSDMGPRPSRKHGIDRIDTNGHYTPENCRWATAFQQQNNKRNTRHVEYRGQRLPLRDAVRLAGSNIHPETIWNRIHRCGLSFEEALQLAVVDVLIDSGNRRFIKTLDYGAWVFNKVRA